MMLRGGVLNVLSLKCVSLNNPKCKIKPEIIVTNNNEPLLYRYCVKISKCSGSGNNINDPYAELCVPDVVKGLYVKVFNLMSRNNEARHTVWYEICRCKCRLNASVCNNKQVGKMQM